MDRIIGSMDIGIGVLTHSGCPNSEIYAELREEKLDCWWNLAEELYEFVPGMKAIAREVRLAQIPDFGVPLVLGLFDDQLNGVCSWLELGGHVHVSCFAGIGRTGLAVACIRVRSLGESPEEALAAAWKACGGPITPQQKDFVRTFARFAAWRCC